MPEILEVELLDPTDPRTVEMQAILRGLPGPPGDESSAELIAEEVERAIAAEAALAQVVQQEAATRQAADQQEATTRSQADVSIVGSVNTERSERQAADTAEATARSNADASLGSRATALEAALPAATAALEQADEDEAEAREDADAGLQQALVDEAATRVQAIADLDAAKVDVSAIGVTVAPLVAGLVPAINLPGFVDDVLEFANFAALPGIGESGKIYVLDTPYTSGGFTTTQFRWGGSVYVPIAQSPGSTDAVPEGAGNKYFTFQRVRDTLLTGISFASSVAVAATDSALIAVGKLQAIATDIALVLTNHIGNNANPHAVTKAQVGLGNADNTSDVNKPVSTATASAIAAIAEPGGTLNQVLAKLSAADFDYGWASVGSLSPILANNGGAGAPAYSFASDSTKGMHGGTANEVRIATAGVDGLRVANSGVFVSAGAAFGFGSSGVTNADAVLFRDATGQLAQRLTTAAQQFNIYNTWANASNYERAIGSWQAVSNVFRIATQALGTGVARELSLQSAASLRLNSDGGNFSWAISTTGNFFPSQTTLQSVGSDANRFRNILQAGFHANSATQRAVPTTGQTVVVPANTNTQIIDPATAIANLTVTMPVTPVDGQYLELPITKAITTALTISGAGVTVVGAPATTAGYVTLRFRYLLSTTTWYAV